MHTLTFTPPHNIYLSNPPPLATLIDDITGATLEFQPDSPHRQSYSTWLKDWTSHFSNVSLSILVPLEATSITTPLRCSRWQLRIPLRSPKYRSYCIFHQWYHTGISIGLQWPPLITNIGTKEPRGCPAAS